MRMKYFTYILYSIRLRRFYIGCSRDTEVRLKKHLSKHNGFTGKAKDWREYLKEEYDTKSPALRRERQLKSWKNKERIWQFIERSHTELFLEAKAFDPGDEDCTLSSVG